jgi:hypothetical protein
VEIILPPSPLKKRQEIGVRERGAFKKKKAGEGGKVGLRKGQEQGVLIFFKNYEILSWNLIIILYCLMYFDCENVCYF